LVKKGGCAAKVPATVLREILSGVDFPPRRPEILVDGATFDDAAVIIPPVDALLIQTLDFFTPIVDSPEHFGRIAAANALSDVYAMGGLPLSCMAILTFPSATLELDIVRRIIQSASDLIRLSGASLVGGHSVDDDTLKFGLSVTGYVAKDRVWTNAGARVGDSLILTKPIGTGTLMAALKSGARTESDLADAIESMGQLNRVPALLAPEANSHVHAATDVTGFGLAGHGMQLAQASGVSLQIDVDRIPTFLGVRESLSEGKLTRAHASNREYTERQIEISKRDVEDALLVVDPQTSGGLLLSVSPDRAEEILRTIRSEFPSAALIGEVVAKHDKAVLFR
ncbi:MAG: selenide, water dikinase SelD, partial [Deltaproteobacteria bacterium]|nr:selenide, water dikinase SelD [Deltaproteobacteria bacterium]